MTDFWPVTAYVSIALLLINALTDFCLYKEHPQSVFFFVGPGILLGAALCKSFGLL